MNWLAHIYLSSGGNDSKLGNLLGDFVTNVDWKKKYNKTIRDGIKTHFEIDRFTNTHPVFHQSCRRISKKNSFYSTLLIDVFYDYFLANTWHEYSESPLSDYVYNFYNHLSIYKEEQILPDRLSQIVPAMISEDWLGSYKSPTGIQNALNRLSKRIKTQNTVADCITELAVNEPALEQDFKEFFPQLKEKITSSFN
jgi:acyl carrier protein phosphodiesterase